MIDEYRTRGHMPWSNVEARLRSMREIWVASASPRGRADATPVWFWWDGRCAYFTCASVSRKARNIAHEPAIVVLNGDGTDPIILKGNAGRVTDPTELARVDKAYADKYVDPQSGRRATIYVADDYVYRVSPRLVSAWSYATCSNRTDWRFR